MNSKDKVACNNSKASHLKVWMERESLLQTQK